MEKYESVIVVQSSITNEESKKVGEKFKNLLEENGTLEVYEDMGKRRLAYEIKGNKEAFYFRYEFETEPDFIAELERQYRIDENVLKFITVRAD